LFGSIEIGFAEIANAVQKVTLGVRLVVKHFTKVREKIIVVIRLFVLRLVRLPKIW
jgi:hypothetical protein